MRDLIATVAYPVALGVCMLDPVTAVTQVTSNDSQSHFPLRHRGTSSSSDVRTSASHTRASVRVYTSKRLIDSSCSATNSMVAMRMEKVALEEAETPAGAVSKSSMLEMEDETPRSSDLHVAVDVAHSHSHHHDNSHHGHGHSHGHSHAPATIAKKSSLPKLQLKLDTEIDHHMDPPAFKDKHDSQCHGHDHSHDHSHDHAHGHSHDHDDDDLDDPHRLLDSAAVKKLKQACLCSFVFMCMQFVGGYYADSLAIMTDAAHLLSDVASFLVSLFAIYVASFPASATMPFGYQRAEVIGALISVLIIWMLTLALLYAAVQRMIAQSQPDAAQTVNGQVMFLVSGFGLGINLLLMKILGHGHSHGGGLGAHGHSHSSHGHRHGPDKVVIVDDVQQSPSVQDDSFIKTPMSAVALIDIDNCSDGASVDGAAAHSHHSAAFENINVRAAYIHALGDFIQSLGVCLAGALIWYNPAWQIADPITTILFSFLVLGTTYGILTRSVLILMEAAPPSLNLRVLEQQLRALEAVYDVHDLRVWALTDGALAGSVHVVANGDHATALRATQTFLRTVGVATLTIQVEDPGEHEWRDADAFCAWTTYSTSESRMSVPRAAATSRAAMTTFE